MVEKERSIFKPKSTFFPTHCKGHWVETFENLVKEDLRRIKRDKRTLNLSKKEREALKNLKENKKIVIKPADKGGSVVIQDVDQYHQEVMRQLGDENTYEILKTDPSIRIMEKLQTSVDLNMRKGVISKEIKDYLIVQNPSIPVFYILPKIHKDPVCPPGRPIVAEDFYLQLKGTAMGTRFAPCYANMFMRWWEEHQIRMNPMKHFYYTSVIGATVGYGLNGACDTLISQIYGGKKLKLIGLIVQRAILILTLACFPCWAFYINTENILLLCGQNKEVAREAELCVLAMIPALPAFFFFELQLRYLQNQEIIWPQIVISCMANIVNALMNYLLLFVLQIGVIGAALAMSTGATFQCILLFIYIRVRKLHTASWPGWSTECLEDWGSFLALGFPNILMISIKLWAQQIAIILAGLISLVELGGQLILFQLITLVQKIPFSLGMAVSIRVGIFLGAGETDEAKKSAKLSMILTATSTLLIFILLVSLRNPLGQIFTNDKDILLLVSHSMPICALFHVFGSPFNAVAGLLRGIGMPHIGALASLIGYCLIAFPVGVPLMFSAKLGIKGYWIGMTIGFVFINVYLCIYFWRLNWTLLTEKAQEQVCLKKKPVPFCEHSIDTPDDIELSNYAALDSTSGETELPENIAHRMDKQARKRLIIRRVFEALAIIATFLIGLIIKFTVKRH
ncbi:multidrug and toxin extrusion protein 1-like [Mixophyes fleayi]|uniref:multidrug and toxin extrusion protein 1-like n=1 Tax=Mixophyes fleayi TaxID=3061075 RepID=UPI003F4E1931